MGLRHKATARGASAITSALASRSRSRAGTRCRGHALPRARGARRKLRQQQPREIPLCRLPLATPPLASRWGRLVGGVLLAAFDGYPNYRAGAWLLAPLPVLAIKGERFGVNVSGVPTIRGRLDGAIAVQFKVRCARGRAVVDPSPICDGLQKGIARAIISCFRLPQRAGRSSGLPAAGICGSAGKSRKPLPGRADGERQDRLF
jgi:hypothetical protein